jgi:hypothetical protein
LTLRVTVGSISNLLCHIQLCRLTSYPAPKTMSRSCLLRCIVSTRCSGYLGLSGLGSWALGLAKRENDPPWKASSLRTTSYRILCQKICDTKSSLGVQVSGISSGAFSMRGDRWREICYKNTRTHTCSSGALMSLGFVGVPALLDTTTDASQLLRQ